ncbi:sialate O-acetylesterase [Parapedobacter sp. 10938]|uniref:sialate O-acetylesterase n=1 Tax=Parapedobacter flavus TaxID=3110225 RepID=UPI002DBFD6C4|nr:sialate O-acetylesterase [Parapedobacter sp. 10938]MEC3879688.1 sialate O-acetylesterase [Parapedobacter sp. 10938]
MRKTFLLTCLAVALQLACFGQLRIPHVLSDNMVLQRNADANIWGWGYAASEVTIKASWLDDTVKTTVDNGGRWMVQLPTTQAGGPYEVEIASAGTKITLDNILLGDVWLCSGQSNMEWGGNQQLQEILDELPQANDNQIRLLQVSRTAADYPQDDIPNNWQTLSAESLKPFSAIGYFIAKKLRAELDVPIGIINASWGGTPAEVWTPDYLIENDKELHRLGDLQGESPYRPNDAGVLWNSMIRPLTSFALSGFYWYQGESNVGTWQGYDKLMRAMVTSWRMAWDAELPFYFVQIAPFTYGNEQPLAALLREQQDMTAKTLPNTGMVVVSDLVDDIKNIHPAQKREVANRLATIALNAHYGVRNDSDYRSPLYKTHRVQGKAIAVSFDYLTDGLKVKGDRITDLYIAGADHVFHEAQGVIKGNELIVSSPEVTEPVAVRFGFTETAMPNLFNTNGLPVAPFRTDNWDF